MTLHEQRRDHDYDPDCFGCKAAGLRFNLSPAFRAVESKERVLTKDLDAYARLRKEGLQPHGVTGSAKLEARAEHKVDIERSNSPLVPHMTSRQKDQLVQAEKVTA